MTSCIFDLLLWVFSWTLQAYDSKMFLFDTDLSSSQQTLTSPHLLCVQFLKLFRLNMPKLDSSSPKPSTSAGGYSIHTASEVQLILDFSPSLNFSIYLVTKSFQLYIPLTSTLLQQQLPAGQAASQLSLHFRALCVIRFSNSPKERRATPAPALDFLTLDKEEVSASICTKTQ